MSYEFVDAYQCLHYCQISVSLTAKKWPMSYYSRIRSYLAGHTKLLKFVYYFIIF